MADEDPYVNPMVTDAFIQANVSALGNSSALSVAQTSLALAQSQSVLFAHMVNSYATGATAVLLNNKRGDDDLKTAAAHAEQTRAIEDLRDLVRDFIAANKNDLACY